MFNITCLDQDGTPIQNFTQWDMGQSILIDGLTLDKPPQVHYWNAQSAQAYVDDKVTLVDGKYKSTVPNALLMSAIAIYVAIYPFDSATTSGKTIAQVRLSVNPRPEPSDYIFENNVDIVYIRDLVEEIDGVKNTVDTELVPKMNAFRAEVSKATTDVKNVSTAEQGKIATKSTEEQNKITTLATTHKQEMQKIKDSIPADYNTLSANMLTVLDTFADGIKNTASGAVMAIDDSSEKKCEVEILGKTVQDGTPTPDNPVPIKGVGESGSIKLVELGRNLCHPLTASTSNGITLTNNGDGSYTLNGTATEAAFFSDKISRVTPLPKTTYYIQVNNTQAFTGFSVFRLRSVNDKVWNVSLNSVNAKGIVTTDEFPNYIDIRIEKGNTFNNVVIKPQIELLGYGDFENTKELITYNIPLTAPLYSLDKTDRIYKKDKTCGVERWNQVIDAWDTVDLRRNDVWSSNANMDLFYVSQSGLKVCDCISNIFKKQSSEFKTGIFMNDYNVLYFSFSKSYGITTVELLKKYLTEHNCKVIVRTETPTFEPFSEELQKKLIALTTYCGTTVLYTTDELQPTINIDYIADTKLYINKQIKNAVADLQSQLASTLSLMPTNVQATMIENDTNNLLQSI